MIDAADYFASDAAPEPPAEPAAPRGRVIPDLTLEAGLPANVDAERTILGAVLLDNKAHAEAAEKLAADDFSLDSHRRIFLRMTDLIDRDRAVDIVTLANELQRHKEVEAVGGVAYLASLTEGLPRRPVVTEYIRIVKEKSMARRLMSICSTAIARAADQSEGALDVLDDTESQLHSVSDLGVSSPLETFGAYIQQNYPSIDHIFKTNAKEQGLPTGLTELDDLTCGLQKGNLIILAARPGMGKTALGLRFGLHAGVTLQRVVGFFSLEMSKQEIMQRAIADLGGVKLRDILSGIWTPTSRRYATDAVSSLVESQFHIDDEPGLTVQRIKAKAMRLKNQMGRLDLVVVDQLNHIELPSEARKMTRTDQIGAVSRALKAMAKALDCPVVVLHQLNRDVEKREEREPRLSDLRDSGNIEQDADVVMFIHRPAYYNRDEEMSDLQRAQAFIILAKQRMGAIGKAECLFIGPFLRFEDREQAPPIW